MKKIILPALSLILIMACNQVNSNSDKNITQNGDTISSVDISVSKTGGLMDMVEELEKADASSNKLLFKASGTEPGWIAEFYANKLRLILNYGKDSIIIEDEFSHLDDAKGYLYSKATSEHGEKYALTIALENKSCINTAGNKEDRAVNVKFNNKPYTGCGSFIK